MPKAPLRARRTSQAAEPPLSASVQVILEQLESQKLSKTEFARLLGVSPDYVYRILKGRVPFPYVRETIERISEICGLDPHVFSEYREMEQRLSPSTRLVWQRMKELGMSREDLFQALGERISRPYFNSILRGDQPFPHNRAYVHLFALALDLPPTVFREFGSLQTARWGDEEIAEVEERFFQLLFDKMLADRGYAKTPIALNVIDALVMGVFPPENAYDPALIEIFKRMGELNMGLPELEKISGLEPEVVRQMVTGKTDAKRHAAHVKAIREALRL